ncbi:amino acid ABC transporter substrate-binding protein [Motiliproteus coralliicola]|uniref:Amino acid ABC transporter substrate-binding protein n=1 Tax=Motiliproteus coralliicola TaxID=2283196 RepID=A0A369WDW5_9GAMM|nr:amino acid ABC transporter substrate-binding protein [Motiliproteus coralliicola]RDE19837.1 amino acid ABC transporter substrate-binding protein [Motiliproteus coralliicola]
MEVNKAIYPSRIRRESAIQGMAVSDRVDRGGYNILGWTNRRGDWVRFCLWLLGLLLSAASLAASSAERIPLVTYHIAPPFIVDRDARIGLTYDLAEFLTERSEGRFHFVVEGLPRMRVNSRLEKSSPLVVPWVNPHWFKDPTMERYLWTSGYLPDNNAVLSSVIKPIEYTGPDSLIGKSLSGVLGGRWVGVDPLIEQGKIKRVDTSSYLSTLRMVLHGRVDATIIPSPVAKYLISQERFSGYFHFSARPHTEYLRHFLVKERPDVRRFLEAQVPILRDDPRWKASMASYGM